MTIVLRRSFLAAFKDTKNPDLVRYVQHLSKPTTRILYGAPVFILVFASPDVIDENDCALAAENMMLAALLFRDRQLLVLVWR